MIEPEIVEKTQALLKDLPGMPRQPVQCTAVQLAKRIHTAPSDKVTKIIREIYEKKSVSDGVYNLWGMFFALKWCQILNPDTFIEDSSNCEFSFLPVKSCDGKEQILFFKVVPALLVVSKSTDNSLVDNINGRFLEHICKSNTFLRQHLANYIDSFTSMVRKSGGQMQTWPIEEILDPQAPECPLSDNFDPAAFGGSKPFDTICLTSIFETIDGRSIMDTLEDKPVMAIEVLKGLSSFCNVLRYLGLKYGMMHNDLHLGNVFLENGTNRLVLIDYGRMTFPDSPLLQQMTKDELNKNFWDEEGETYQTLTHKQHTSAKYYDDMIYFDHVFDVATLMANLHCELQYASLEDNWTWFDSFFQVTDPDERTSTRIYLPENRADLRANFCAAMDVIENAEIEPSIKSGVRLIGDGLMIMAHYLMFIRGSKKRSEVKLESLKGKVHLYFQILSFPREFYDFFMEDLDHEIIKRSVTLQALFANKVRRSSPQIRTLSGGNITNTLQDPWATLQSYASKKKYSVPFEKPYPKSVRSTPQLQITPSQMITVRGGHTNKKGLKLKKGVLEK